MQVSPENMLARIMRLENQVFNNNGVGWQSVTLDAGWTTNLAPQYAMVVVGGFPFLLLSGSVQVAAGFSSKTLNNSNPIPSAYRPAHSHDVKYGDAVGNRCHITVGAAGVVTAFAYSGWTTGLLVAELDGCICPLT